MSSHGSFVTFYSYKGGVGRSFILASVAVTLAEWGRKVLCLDWDLEAPGLVHYLRRWMPAKYRGIVDMTEALASDGGAWPDWREHVVQLKLPRGLTLDLIPAGSSPDYASRVQQIDWTLLYERHALGEHLEQLRTEISQAYDIVLIDSRTGVTDAGGICTVQLPDLLAMVYTANEQSVEGTLDIASRIGRARDALAFDRKALPIVPLLSRFDSREERALSAQWVRRIASQLKPLYAPWLPAGIEPQQVIERTTVPYVTFWSFGEGIPTLDESATSPEMISWSLETVAALIANGLNDVSTLIGNRDQFVSSARLHKRQTNLTYDAFLSFQRREMQTARGVADALSKAGVNVFLDADVGAGSEAQTTQLQQALASSRHLIVLIRDELSKLQEHELRQFFIGLVDRRTDSRVVVLREKGSTRSLPPALAGFQSMEIDGVMNPAEVHALRGILGLQGAAEPAAAEHVAATMPPAPARGTGAASAASKVGVVRRANAFDSRENLKAWLRTRPPREKQEKIACPACGALVYGSNMVRHWDVVHPFPKDK